MVHYDLPFILSPDGNLFENDKTSCQYSSECKANPHWIEGDTSTTIGVRVRGKHFDLSESSSTGYSTHIRQPPTSIIVKFPDIYLVNLITLQLLTPVMYTVQVSINNNQWRMLFDYSKFMCTGEQQLYFPKQAVRY